MKGSTHLTIGTAIGIGAAAVYSHSLTQAALLITAASFSALAADLDGASLLSSKLSKVSRVIRILAPWAGVLAVVALVLYGTRNGFAPLPSAAAVALLLLGLTAKEGAIRNALVSAIGCALLYAAWMGDSRGLLGLGAFVVIAPWLKHRGLTHTIWALALWAAIGRQLEAEWAIPGLAAASAAGYLSHLAADTLTPSGVKWLSPLVKKSFKLR
ncbi:metal-dependent hydrolase [Gorillibacterium timonense]|uniref:metal-dependent hydrolase n=1 Tax=Gorillibacterium timonense TaxID=1689269 RepID=UPI00071E5200|nr:metal-dependent hydrolase [Gorillibacterium timonense]